MPTPRVVLSIAGSDSGAGAGIQADLKTFAALGVYGTCAITAVTAQNTRGVRGVEVLSTGSVRAQILAVQEDFELAAVKTGMLASRGIIECVAEVLSGNRPPHLVIDPVMVAESGDSLLEPDAVELLVERLLPLADVLTPNLPEAAVLLGRELAESAEGRLRDAREILALGARAVVLKGGHAAGDEIEDLLVDAEGAWSFRGPRLDSRATHGTGCTLASAIAALLARGRDLPQAVAEARDYVSEGIRQAAPLGHGHGPLHHFHEFYGPEGLP
jgi:hydroxymethylpyrimidine/phosphomethylpyrimidine kinase